MWNVHTGQELSSLFYKANHFSRFAITPDSQLMAGACLSILKLSQLLVNPPINWPATVLSWDSL